MRIKIKEKELELHYSMRIHILYENIMNQTLSNSDKVGTTTSMIVLMYCAIVASMQYYRMNETLSYDDFLDWVDQQGPSIFTEFGQWFTESVEAYNSIGADKSDDGTQGAPERTYTQKGKKGSAKKASPNA
jgi:hypothetical protein